MGLEQDFSTWKRQGFTAVPPACWLNRARYLDPVRRCGESTLYVEALLLLRVIACRSSSVLCLRAATDLQPGPGQEGDRPRSRRNPYIDPVAIEAKRLRSRRIVPPASVMFRFVSYDLSTSRVSPIPNVSGKGNSPNGDATEAGGNGSVGRKALRHVQKELARGPGGCPHQGWVAKVAAPGLSPIWNSPARITRVGRVRRTITSSRRTSVSGLHDDPGDSARQVRTGNNGYGPTREACHRVLTQFWADSPVSFRSNH